MVDPLQIRAARALLNWSQEQLAVRAGIGVRTVGSLERGGSNLEPETVAAVVGALQAAGIEFLSAPGRRGVVGPQIRR